MKLLKILRQITFLWVSFILLGFTHTVWADDSQKILESIKKSYPTGMISVERSTGKLLLNPVINKLKEREADEKFFVPSMIIDQSHGLRLVDEFPMSCFLVPSFELAQDKYKPYRQHEVVNHLLDNEKFPVTHVMICSLANIPPQAWKHSLSLTNRKDKFTFEETKSQEGEQFFYYLDADGYFEMYMKT